MFAAAGDGHLLSLYVVYRAENLYNTWVSGGLPGTVYNRSKSGWFTMEIFEDWFIKIVLPHFRKFDSEKPKIIIGDNLTSHVSKWVIEQCTLNNIKFVLLPPNSTGICQPLDVAYFKPLKSKWSQLLSEWKSKHRGTIPKDTFPRLKYQCLIAMSDKSSDNIQAGFRASGLIPLDREQVLERLPKQSAEGEIENSQEWVSSFKEFLQESRPKETRPLKARKSRLNLLPGKGIDESMLQTSTQPSPSGHKQQRKKKTQVMSESDDSTITLHDE